MQSLFVSKTKLEWHTFRVVLGRAYRCLIVGLFFLQNFSVVISVSRHVCIILVLNFDFYVSKIVHL